MGEMYQNISDYIFPKHYHKKGALCLPDNAHFLYRTERSQGSVFMHTATPQFFVLNVMYPPYVVYCSRQILNRASLSGGIFF
jgi:hypothetical protein